MSIGKITAWVLVAVAAVTTLGACNTVRGVGQDVERGGRALQDATK